MSSSSTLLVFRRALAALFFSLLLALNLEHCKGFCLGRASKNCQASPLLLLHQESYKNNNNDSEEKNKKEEIDNELSSSYSWAELQADEELRQLELKSSLKQRNNILLPQQISRAIYTLGWIFVITGIILNQFGFAYVQKPGSAGGGIGIGTLDQRNFQREVYRQRKDATNNNVISRANDNIAGDEFSKTWVSSKEEQQ